MREGGLKRWLFRAADELRVVGIAQAWLRGVPILAYHGVTVAPETQLRNLRRLHIPADRFEEHLRILARDWHPIALADFVDAIEAGSPLPQRSVIVTFDDGYRNFLTVGLPLLRKHGVPATLFVLTGRSGRMWEDEIELAVERTSAAAVRWNGFELPLRSIAEKHRALATIVAGFERSGPARGRGIADFLDQLGRGGASEEDDDRDLLSWEEIAVIRRAGFEIGSHADRHGPLTERPLEEVKNALLSSRQELERRLGAGRYALAYPYGAWNPLVAAEARAAGFCCALIGRPGLNGRNAELFGLRRFLIGADDDGSRLRASLSGLRALWQRQNAWSPS